MIKNLAMNFLNYFTPNTQKVALQWKKAQTHNHFST